MRPSRGSTPWTSVFWLLKKIAALEPPPTSETGSPQWIALRERSSGWIPITLPLVIDDVDSHLEVADGPDLRGGFDPELALSLLIRSQRRQSGGRTVTDFEAWVHPSVDAESYEVRTSSNYIAQVDPGVRLGLGYDGSNGTWNAAIAPRDGSPENEASISIKRDTTGDEPDIVFGPPYDTRIVARNVSAELHLRELGEPSVEAIATIEGLGLVITNRWFRSLGEMASSGEEDIPCDVNGEPLALFCSDGVLTWPKKQFPKRSPLKRRLRRRRAPNRSTLRRSWIS